MPKSPSLVAIVMTEKAAENTPKSRGPNEREIIIIARADMAVPPILPNATMAEDLKPFDENILNLFNT